MSIGGEQAINSFGSKVTLDTFNNRVFSHQVFGISKRFSISSEGVIDIMFDSTAFDKSTLALLPFSIGGYDAGPLNVDLYTGSTYTGGTTWPGTDRNFCDTVVTPKVFGVHAPTINVLGAKSEAEFYVPSNGVPAVSRIAGSTKEDLLFKLLPGIVYHIRITNTTASTGTGIFSMNWFEV